MAQQGLPPYNDDPAVSEPHVSEAPEGARRHRMKPGPYASLITEAQALGIVTDEYDDSYDSTQALKREIARRAQAAATANEPPPRVIADTHKDAPAMPIQLKMTESAAFGSYIALDKIIDPDLHDDPELTEDDTKNLVRLREMLRQQGAATLG